MKQKILYFITISFWVLPGLMAQDVVFSDAEVAPSTSTATSTLLKVHSNEGNKGMLFPRMSEADLVNITNKVPGMMVFVVDGTPPGLWVFDGQSNEFRALNSEENIANQASAPFGSIIMYMGPTENLFDGFGSGVGDMDGWQICNGNNGSPNLTGRYVKSYGGDAIYTPNSANEYYNDAYYSDGGGYDQIIEKENLAEHNHAFKNLTLSLKGHMHSFNSDGTVATKVQFVHRHGYGDRPKNPDTYADDISKVGSNGNTIPVAMVTETKANGNKIKDDDDLSEIRYFVKYVKDNQQVIYKSPVSDIDFIATDEVIDKSNGGKVKYEVFPSTTDEAVGANIPEDEKKVDNKPTSTVVLFLIKIP